jgi:hypothetical protein
MAIASSDKGNKEAQQKLNRAIIQREKSIVNIVDRESTKATSSVWQSGYGKIVTLKSNYKELVGKLGTYQKKFYYITTRYI